MALGLTYLAGTGLTLADLIAYEGFDYPTGTSLTGVTGPTGFSAPYTAANAGLKTIAGGSTFGDLPVTGNKLEFSGNGNGNFGVLSNAPHAPGTTVYLSYLMQVNPTANYAGVSLYQGTEEVLFTGKRDGTPYVFGIEPKGGTFVKSTISSTQLSFVVYRLDFNETSTTIRMYVNPQSGEEPAEADLVATSGVPITYDRIRVQSHNAVGSVDEIRLGETFADVAPITYGSIPNEIVVLGSSVAHGQGASTQSEGWAFRLKTLLETQAPIVPDSHMAWSVIGASVPGNNTTNVLNRFENDVVLARAGADTVIISLSLANEGLVGSSNPQAVFDSFKNGLTQIIQRCRAAGLQPVVTLCYPQNLYNAEQYAYVRKMNLLMNTWDVPSINFLGAIDDGSGHWTNGYFVDDGHPNSQGHLEMYSSIVPTLFDAIAAGKTETPKWDGTPAYLRLQRDENTNSPLVYSPQHALRSFNLSFRVRTTEAGTVAAIGSGATGSTLEIKSDEFTYTNAAGAATNIPVSLADGRWHDIAISQRQTTGQVLLFINGQLRATVNETINPATFTIGGNAGISGRTPAPLQADYQDVGIYRAAWTEDEALAQSNGALQQSSLEVLSTLDDSELVQGALLENRAQSVAALTLQSSSFTTNTSALAPDGLSAESYAATTISLQWNAPGSNTAPFTVERRRSGISEAWTTVGTTAAGVTSLEDTGLAAGTSYDYRVSISEGGFQGDYSNIISIAPAGQSSTSYDDWITGYYPVPQDNAVYLVDFNSQTSPNYGGIIWNKVDNPNVSGPYALRDTDNNASGINVSITDAFDQFRENNDAPIVDYASVAQNTQFALRDDANKTGIITITGLDPSESYDFSFFARRGGTGAIVGGFHYIGDYTFVGAGAPVTVTVNAANNTSLRHVPRITPDASGMVTLTIKPGTVSGTDTAFPVINFLKFRKSTPAAYLVDFNTDASPTYNGLKWNTLGSMNAGSAIALQNSYGESSNYSVAVTNAFDQFRNDNGAPFGEFPAVAQATQFALRDDPGLTGAITFTGLDPAAQYDFSFFARRGPTVANFHYVGSYSFAGSGDPVVVTANAAGNTTLTMVPPVTPSGSGEVTLTITPGPGASQPFPVINFIQFKKIEPSTDYLALIDPNADPDGDGMSNLEEYARGFNPTVTEDSQQLLVGSFELNSTQNGTLLEITRDRSKPNADYVIQTSTDLESWDIDTSAVRTVTSHNGPQERLQFESPVSGDARFFRLKLVQVP